MIDSKKYQEFLNTYEAEKNQKLIPASTVVILRDSEQGIEVLMVRRNPDLKFMGGAWVFPGGRVDKSDIDSSSDLSAAIVKSAVREVKEETNLDLNSDDILTHSHWVPPPLLPKLFATWFFFAPDPKTEIKVDGSEILDHQWITPTDALKKRDAGEYEFAPPTFVTLSLLNKYDSAQKALDAAAKISEPAFYATKIVSSEQGSIALWEGDAGYLDGNPNIPGKRNRLNISAEKWELEIENSD